MLEGSTCAFIGIGTRHGRNSQGCRKRGLLSKLVTNRPCPVWLGLGDLFLL